MEETIMTSPQDSPPIGYENTKVDDTKTLCKLFLKGKPSRLKVVIDQLLSSQIPLKSNGNGAYVKSEMEPECVVTLLLEKL